MRLCSQVKEFPPYTAPPRTDESTEICRTTWKLLSNTYTWTASAYHWSFLIVSHPAVDHQIWRGESPLMWDIGFIPQRHPLLGLEA